MKKLCLTFLILFFVFTCFAQSNQKRIALVIGNSAYQHGGSLKNPVNDANLMATTLQGLGFTVIKKLDANLRTMQIASADFKSKLKDFDVALFFYAGHGIQVDGINYLVPVDATLDRREMVKYDAFSINDINEAFMSNSQNTNIMILDACRNDPFRSWSRGGERGFTKIDNPSKGTIIAFATQPGSTAADGEGANGLYTSRLVKQMKISQNIESVFKNTRKAVNDASGGNQVPQDWSSLMDDFYFKTPSGNVTTINAVYNNEPEESGFVQGNVIESYGSISIDSEIGGTLYIDGVYKGDINANSTGNKLTKITPGSYSIKIEGDETWEKTITVSKDQTTKVSVKSNKVKDLPDQLFDSRDNKYYKIVKIGTQVWMAENLAFNTGSNCWAYDDNQSNVTKYGYLYNWETAKYACPSGWRLPSKSDFETLLNNFGGNGSEACRALLPDGSSGFMALLGGCRGYRMLFCNIGTTAYFWSASGPDEISATFMLLSSDMFGEKVLIISDTNKDPRRDKDGKSLGHSVRCLKNN